MLKWLLKSLLILIALVMISFILPVTSFCVKGGEKLDRRGGAKIHHL